MGERLRDYGRVGRRIGCRVIALEGPVELTIPASHYMQIGVTANGGHFLFQQPIAITLDYSRCSSDVQQKTLSVWNINPSTKALLQNMGGIDNKLLHQITFTTSYLSG